MPDRKEVNFLVRGFRVTITVCNGVVTVQLEPW
jgi:hypothetical protein